MAELAERMSAEEFEYWQAFYQIQPFGQEWEEIRTAYQTVNICQIQTRSQLKTESYAAWKPKRREQTAEEQAALVLAAIGEMNRGK